MQPDVATGRSQFIDERRFIQAARGIDQAYAAPSDRKCRYIESIGVMPIPPAISTE